MNKKYAIGLALSICISTFTAVAQTSGGVRMELPAELVRNFQMGNNKFPDNVLGTPYLNEEFVAGIVDVNGQNYNVRLRYNAYNDEIQMKNEKNEDIALFKRDYITATFDGTTFQIIELDEGKKGYAMRLADGKIGLYKRHIKQFIPEKEASTSYQSSKPAQLVDEITYFVKKADGSFEEVRLKKKDFMVALGEDNVKNYLAENKSKLNTERDVINMINSLNNNSI